MPEERLTLEIKGSNLFIPGEEVGLGSDQCVLGTFKQTNGRQDAWYLGNVALGDYYTIFDMTPKTERGADFIQIGFAPMNPSGPTLEKYAPLPDPPPKQDDPEPEPEKKPVTPVDPNPNGSSDTNTDNGKDPAQDHSGGTT